MAINKKLIHFNTFENFNSKKLSANVENTKYTLGIDGEIQDGSPDILYLSIVYIKDTKQQWTHGLLYDAVNKKYVDTQLQLKPNQEDIDFSDNIIHILNIVWNKEVEMAPLGAVDFDFDSYPLVLCKTYGRITYNENIQVYNDWIICYYLPENDVYAIPHYDNLHKYNINKCIEYSDSRINVRNNKLFNFYGNIISFMKSRPLCTGFGSPIESTYRDLLNIKINGCLIPGLQYLITDYIPCNFLGRYNIINFPRLNIIVTANDFSSFKSEAIAYTKSYNDYYNECTKFNIKFSFEDEFNYKFYVAAPEATIDAVYLGSGIFNEMSRHFYYWNHKVFSQDDMGPETFIGVDYNSPFYLHAFTESMFEYDAIKQYVPKTGTSMAVAIHDVIMSRIGSEYNRVSSLNYEYTGMIYYMSDSSGAVANYDYVCIKNGDVIPVIYTDLINLSLSGLFSPNQIYELLDYRIESFTTSDNVLIRQNPKVNVKLRIKAKDKTSLCEDVDYIITDINGETKTFKAKYSLYPTSKYFTSQPGVITWLKDDLENEAPFDFYQMLFDFTKKSFSPDYLDGNLLWGPQGWANSVGGWLNAYLLPFDNGPWRDNTKNNKIKFNGNMFSFPIIISGDPIPGVPPLSNNDIEITHGPDASGNTFIYLYPHRDLCNHNKIKFDRFYPFPEDILFLTGSNNDLLNCLGQFSSLNSQIKESRIISKNRSCSLYNNDIKCSNIITSDIIDINNSSFKYCDCTCDVNPNLNAPKHLIENCVFESGSLLNFYNVLSMHNVKSTGSFDFKNLIACADGNLINGIFVPNHVLTSIPLIMYVPNEDLMPTDPETNILYLIGEEG